MKHELIFLTLAVLSVTQMQAQHKTEYTNFTDTTFNLQEVTVQSTHEKPVEVLKLNVPLKYLPVSTRTIPAATLEMRGITNLQDAVKFLPGTRMRTTYGAYQQFEVRGFDYTPIMIDGVRDERTSITNSAPFPDLTSVESIELLKGPASVLYGHSTAGGILNVVRKTPVEKTVVNARLSYGSWDNKQATMDFGGKVYKTLNYRAVINWSDNEGYRYTNDKRFSGYLALSARLDDRQTLDLRGGFNRDWYGTEIGLPRFMTDDIYNSDGSRFLEKGEMLPGVGKRSRYNNESDFMINNGSNLLLKYSNRISEYFRLEDRLAYNYDNIDYFSTEQLRYPESNSPVYDRYYLLSDGTRKYISLDTVELYSPLRFAYTVNVINNELEFSGKTNLGSATYNYLAGYACVAMFRDRYRGYNLGEDVTGPGLFSKVPVFEPHSMGYMTTRFSSAIVNRTFTHSAYLQNLLEFSDRFKLMLSGRYDYFDFRNATAATPTGERKYTGRSDFQKVNNSAWTYRAGAVYLPHEHISIYASAANFFSPFRDFLSPTTIYIDADGNRFYPEDGSEIFKPQTGYQTEAGIRYALNTLLQATGSVYYIRRNNEKKTLATVEEDGVQKSVIGQVGSSEAKGFELELVLTPASNLYLSTGYGYTNAVVRNLNKNEYMAEDPEKGMRQAGVPENTFFAAGHYTIARGCLQNLAFNFTVSYTGNVYRTISKDVVYPAYWLTDAGVAYRWKNGIRLGLNVNNLFDATYYNQSLGRQITPNTPRNFLVSVAYHL
jgi:outer membrane receptor protein involved in Fe transport